MTVVGFDWRDVPELQGMLLDRRRLLRQLAPVLRRVGASNPERSTINRKRSVQRREVRRALRKNSDAIAAYLMELDLR